MGSKLATIGWDLHVESEPAVPSCVGCTLLLSSGVHTVFAKVLLDSQFLMGRLLYSFPLKSLTVDLKSLTVDPIVSH